MKKFTVLVLILVCVLSLTGCGNKLVEGSEKIYHGTVTDRGMSVVNEGDRQGRAYISITANTGDILFWLTKDCETDAQIGDKVLVESAIEDRTNLLVATSITVEEICMNSASIMVDDVVYYLKHEVPGEIDESAIIGYTTSYTDEMPQINGETNFNRELNMPYAKVGEGIAVLYENEWWICEP